MPENTAASIAESVITALRGAKSLFELAPEDDARHCLESILQRGMAALNAETERS